MYILKNQLATKNEKYQTLCLTNDISIIYDNILSHAF